MKKTLPFLPLFSATLLICFPATPLAASQQEAVRPQKLLRHEVAVTLKLIQVYVTDRDGKPARDMEKSDFVLYDNGKARIVTEFEKHFLFVPEAKLGETKPAPARDTSSLMNRKFIFLVDFDSNDLEGIAKARNSALHFMDSQVQPGDEIALLSATFPSGLTLHEYLTSDHQKIRAALDKVLGIPGIVGGWDPLAFWGIELWGMEALDTRSGVGIPHQSRTQSKQLVMGLTTLAKAFRNIPGQKNIILFSRGFGVIPVNPDNPRTKDEKEFVDMGRELASANSPEASITRTSTTMPRSPRTSKIRPAITMSSATPSNPRGTVSSTISRSRSNALDIRSTPNGAISIRSRSPNYPPSKNISTS